MSLKYFTHFSIIKIQGGKQFEQWVAWILCSTAFHNIQTIKSCLPTSEEEESKREKEERVEIHYMIFKIKEKKITFSFSLLSSWCDSSLLFVLSANFSSVTKFQHSVKMLEVYKVFSWQAQCKLVSFTY